MCYGYLKEQFRSCSFEHPQHSLSIVEKEFFLLQTKEEILMNHGIWKLLEFQNCENYMNGIGLDKQHFEHNIVYTRAVPLNRRLCSHSVNLTSDCH